MLQRTYLLPYLFLVEAELASGEGTGTDTRSAPCRRWMETSLYCEEKTWHVALHNPSSLKNTIKQ